MNTNGLGVKIENERFAEMKYIYYCNYSTQCLSCLPDHVNKMCLNRYATLEHNNNLFTTCPLSTKSCLCFWLFKIIER